LTSSPRVAERVARIEDARLVFIGQVLLQDDHFAVRKALGVGAQGRQRLELAHAVAAQAEVRLGHQRKAEAGPRQCVTQFLVGPVARIGDADVARGRGARGRPHLLEVFEFALAYQSAGGDAGIGHGRQGRAAVAQRQSDPLDHDRDADQPFRHFLERAARRSRSERRDSGLLRVEQA
jgi:hypothetical protein